MTRSHAELRSRYEDFFRIERFQYTRKISMAIDDFEERSRRVFNGVSNNNNGGESVAVGCPRVRVSLNELRSENPGLAERMRYDPFRHLRAMESACDIIANEERPNYDKGGVKIKVGIGGPITRAALSPRDLRSRFLSQLVCVEGVATKISAIKAKVVRSVHYCPKTKTQESRDYVDATDPNLGLHELDATGREIPDKMVNISTSVYPTKDKDNNPLETEFGLCQYKDHQTVVMQEMPEKAPLGQLPRSVDLILDHDLVDRVKPGDRFQAVGVYRALAVSSKGQTSTNGLFRTVLIVNNIQLIGNESGNLVFSTTDIRDIRKVSQRKDVLEVLGRSVAPSIYGHDIIKKALVLQQLSGNEKDLENGIRLRGNINILMVGDPSTAKSQLLRAAMNVAPLAISTTGKGSSGVGLTAAVTHDPDTRERRLEAGAMVLADRGLICVDEFDKMAEGDRVAIHEAMEQQTVTINKAGIHVSLNARCSLLAAANPVYGHYDRSKRVQENIGLQDSLLSRFDLLFIVLDQLDPQIDRTIAQHVVNSHRYIGSGNNGRTHHDYHSEDEDEDDDNDDGQARDESKFLQPSIWEKSRQNCWNTVHNEQESETHHHQPRNQDILQQEFLRKYLYFAKVKYTPILTDEAKESIAIFYADMRSRQDAKTLPVTVRSLETIIRLASAHAKVRLSHTIEVDPDCIAAMEIISYAFYHEHSKDATIDKSKNNLAVESSSDNIEGNTDVRRVSKRKIDAVETLDQKIHRIKLSVWNRLNREDGELKINELSLDADDSIVRRALDELDKEKKIMMFEDSIYLT